ncbi:MAG: prephenate dehydratase [Microthrixaceae bacterium]|nr:prephenate dehydratase [Microthrixaceae bacterium]
METEDTDRPTTGNPRRVAFLGPAGTFTEQALHREADLSAAELIECDSMVEALFAVNEGSADLGVVPIENAIEGTVNATIDTLAFDVDLRIQRELVEPVALNLLAPRGAKLGDIKSVHSIPVATAQCRSWLRSNLGTVEHIAANSTAEAAATVANAEDPTAAAIGNRRAAEVYGLEVLGPDIEDHPENHTRFVVVGRDAVPAPTGHDKTSILVYQRADRPGSLLGILQEFAARGINLTLLLSRPTKKNLGDYCFLVDLEGHVDDEVVADCLGTLKATQADVKFLGSYPAAGSDGPSRRAEFGAKANEAREWVRSIRGFVERD